MTLALYDVTGRRLTTLAEREVWPAGTHEVHLRPNHLPTGLYLVRLDSGDERAVQKFVLMK